VQSSQIAQLPEPSTRNFQSLLVIVPGYAPPVSAHSEAGNPQGSLATNVNGASYNNNNTRIEGTSDLYPWLPEIAAYIPPTEAIQTVNVVTASFDAEQGMAGGSVVNVFIKSGTNQFHGSAWEYNQISALKARNYFYYGANNPKNIVNQFGGNFGGPIKKNKLFFFGNWEVTDKRANVSALETVATDPLRAGNFGATGTIIYDPGTGASNGTGRTPFPNNMIPVSRFAFASNKMISLMPEPNQASATSTTNNDYFGSGDYSSTHHNIDTKINYNTNEKATIFGRYAISPSNIFDRPGLGPAEGNTLDGGQPGTSTGRVQSTGFGATYTITPTLLLDGNAGYTRLRLDSENVDIGTNYGLTTLNIPGTNGPYSLDGGYPNFGVTGFSSFGNSNVSNPFLFRDNVYVGAVNLGWIKGTHSFRFGGEYQHFGINHFQPQTSFGPRGGFNFTGGLTALSGGASPNLYNAWADFLLGLPQNMGISTEYINPATVRESSLAFYARDTWQVNRKLTVSYGIRYEYYPFATRDNFGGDVYNPVTGPGNAWLGERNSARCRRQCWLGRYRAAFWSCVPAGREDRYSGRLRHQHRPQQLPGGARRLSGHHRAVDQRRHVLYCFRIVGDGAAPDCRAESERGRIRLADQHHDYHFPAALRSRLCGIAERDHPAADCGFQCAGRLRGNARHPPYRSGEHQRCRTGRRRGRSILLPNYRTNHCYYGNSPVQYVEIRLAAESGDAAAGRGNCRRDIYIFEGSGLRR